VNKQQHVLTARVNNDASTLVQANTTGWIFQDKVVQDDYNIVQTENLVEDVLEDQTEYPL
jgi:hypothetical protein